jgi:hypothetical protein
VNDDVTSAAEKHRGVKALLASHITSSRAAVINPARSDELKDDREDRSQAGLIAQVPQ